MLTDDEWTDVLTSIDPMEVSDPDTYVGELRSMAQEEYGKDLTPEQVERGRWQWAEVVRLDYQEWSGGFLPEDQGDPEVEIYCQTSAMECWDRPALRLALITPS